MPIRALPPRAVPAYRPDLPLAEGAPAHRRRPRNRPGQLRRYARAALTSSTVLRVVGMFVYTLAVIATSTAVATALRGTNQPHPPRVALPRAPAPAVTVARVPVAAATPALNTQPATPPATRVPPPAPPPPAPKPRPVDVPTGTRPPAQEPVAAGDAAHRAVAFALGQLGVPYLWGGASRAGYDCSGLVMRAWESAGVRLPHRARLQAHAGIRVSRADLRPGDLVISNRYGHVALYIGHGQVVQAPHSGTVVSIAPLPTRGVDAYVRP